MSSALLWNRIRLGLFFRLLRLGYAPQLSVPLFLSLPCPLSRILHNCKRPRFFPRRRQKTLDSPSMKNSEPHQSVSKMFYFTSFLKPCGYRRLADPEKPIHRAASPDGSLVPQDESETDLFLPSSSGTQPQQKAIFHRHWRLAIEVLLISCNICLFAFILFRLDAAPLGVRQKECGRLLGQWRTFTISSRHLASWACLVRCTRLRNGHWRSSFSSSLSAFSRSRRKKC